MRDTREWFLEERAEQLAIVHLSRRDDLVITRQTGQDLKLNFMVTLTKEGKYTGRVFGVEVQALNSRKQVRQDSSDEDVFQIDLQRKEIHEDIPFPLCLFVFTMEDDEGFYTWIKKPVCGPDKPSQLLIDETGNFRRLNIKALDEIIEQIDDWYENRLKIPA